MTQSSRRKPLLHKDDFCRRGFSPEPSVFDDTKFAAKAAPTKKDGFCRRGFSPEPPSSMTRGRGFVQFVAEMNFGLQIEKERG
jgi:hypothetical protein